MKKLAYLSIIFLATSCQFFKKDTLFSKLSKSESGIDFINLIEESDKENVLNYEYFYNGGGVAAADFDNDGLTDLYFSANRGTDKIYKNEGELNFKDQTAAAGITFNGEWKTGVSVVDINNDGWQDIYVSVSGNIDNPALRKNKLYINNKNFTFTEKAAEYGLDDHSFTTQTAFFDYDKDGDLDAYLLNHNIKDFNRFDVEAIHAMRDSLAGHKLMRNDNGKFIDVSAAAGIKGNPIGFGLGIHIADLNNDTYPDIYVSNDYIESDYYYLNNQDGTFTDKLKDALDHTSYFSMGNDIADINNDLLPDIFTSDMLPEDNKRQKLLFGPDKYEAYVSMLKNGFQPEIMRNMLHINNGDGTYSEVGQIAGISNTDWSWSPLLADYDNDGYKDLFITNGYLRDYTNNDFIKFYSEQRSEGNDNVLEIINKMPSSKLANYIFKNNGDLTFTNKQKEWGFEDKMVSNGAIYADLDNDGDLEIITNNINEEASIYQNQTNEKEQNSFLRVNLKDPKGTQQYGAKVMVYSEGMAQMIEFTPIHGYQSSIMAPLNFGIGKATKIDSVVVKWSDGNYQKVASPKINSLLQVTYTPTGDKRTEPTNPTIFKEDNTLVVTHQQMPLNDFNRQILLPHMYSYQGPCIAKGDINKDGIEDFYYGGGKGAAGQLFMGIKEGGFKTITNTPFKKDELCTDTDAVFFDADGDNDEDLYVASGGYEYLPNDLMLQDRLYLNDGKGSFTKATDALTPDNFSDSNVELIDYDKDGDQDLFISGSVIPLNYPQANPSRLYQNDKGKFTKVENPAFDNLGLITDAKVIDFDKDGYLDIIAVGEWTPIIQLRNNKGNFERLDNDLNKITGFWQSITTEDFDNDGDQDIIAGNLGLNSQWIASTTQPLSLYYADFDNNGKIDPILACYIQGKNYPAYSRDELTDQLTPLKKVYTTYESYSDKTIEEVLTNFKTVTPTILTANTLKTTYFRNDNGKFTQVELPIQFQFSPTYAMLPIDINGDGYKDLIIGGNQTRGRVRIGNIDANHGMVFLNNKKGEFKYIPQNQSGLKIKGNIRDIQQVNKKLIFGLNSNNLKAYTLQH